jgi:hypothetical protein
MILKLGPEDEVKLVPVAIDDDGLSVPLSQAQSKVTVVRKALDSFRPGFYLCYRRFSVVAITEDHEIMIVDTDGVKEKMISDLLKQWKKDQSLTIKDIVAMVDL